MTDKNLKWAREYVVPIEGELRKMYNSDNRLCEACEYALISGGKRVRAVLTLLGCEAVGGKKEDAIYAAVAYELAHTASLVQDDMIDKSDTRRGKLATHVKFGRSLALLTSDVLLIDMLFVLFHYRDTEVPKKNIMGVINCFNRSVRETALGEVLDLELTNNSHVTEEEYVKVIRLKTAPLISTAVETGAIIGNGNREQIECLSEFGACIGVAWQLEDDILDFIGTESGIGKPIFNDVREKKRNIVYIRAYNKASDSEKRFLESLLGNEETSEEDMKRTEEILRKYRVIEEITELADFYKEKGLTALAKLPNGHARDRLEEISSFVIHRMA